MIFTFDNRGNILFSVMKNMFKLTDAEMYREINIQHSHLCELLKNKSVDYTKLKPALSPNQDENCGEYALVFDTMKISNSFYGYEVFKTLLPIISEFQNSTYSILNGDFIPIDNTIETQIFIKNVLFNEMKQYNATEYKHSSQYYIVYFNKLTHTQIKTLIDVLSMLPYFIGILDLTYTTKSIVKKLLSLILVRLAVVNKNNVILAHESGEDFSSNINLCGYPFEENGFKIVSVSEELFGTLLSYKIENHFPDPDDIGLSINAISVYTNDISELSLTIENEKFINYLKKEDHGKAQLLRILNLYDISKDKLAMVLFKEIKKCYFYNLDFLNEYNTVKFNVCIELPTKAGKLRKTMISLEYLSTINKLRLITIT